VEGENLGICQGQPGVEKHELGVVAAALAATRMLPPFTTGTAHLQTLAQSSGTLRLLKLPLKAFGI